MLKLLRTALILVAVATLALVGSGCTIFKPGSLQLSQPSGIGPVHVHYELCSEDAELEIEDPCDPNGDEGEAQQAIAFLVPKGTVAPAEFGAVPGPGASAIRYLRNPLVESGFSSFAEAQEEPFLPPGFEAIGYLSEPYPETEGPDLEWSVDLDLGLPGAGDGGPFAGPFPAAVFWGWRVVGEGLPVDRPLNCFETFFAKCSRAEEKQTPVTDLRILPPAAAEVFVGGKASIAFPFDFGSSASPLPSFNLAATTTLPQATLALPVTIFSPAAVAPPANRSPLTSRAVTVTVPPKAKPGTYDVTLTATASGGGTVSRVAKLTVTEAKIALGKTKLNRAKGTATLSVQVPSAGTLTASGKGIAKAKRKANGPRTVKLTIRVKGKAKAALLETGRARVRAKVAFKPSNGSVVTRTKRLTLQLDS